MNKNLQLGSIQGGVSEYFSVVDSVLFDLFSAKSNKALLNYKDLALVDVAVVRKFMQHVLNVVVVVLMGAGVSMSFVISNPDLYTGHLDAATDNVVRNNLIERVSKENIQEPQYGYGAVAGVSNQSDTGCSFTIDDVLYPSGSSYKLDSKPVIVCLKFESEKDDDIWVSYADNGVADILDHDSANCTTLSVSNQKSDFSSIAVYSNAGEEVCSLEIN